MSYEHFADCILVDHTMHCHPNYKLFQINPCNLWEWVKFYGLEPVIQVKQLNQITFVQEDSEATTISPKTYKINIGLTRLHLFTNKGLLF